MAIELISIQGLWPVFSRMPWLAALLARRYFTASRLAGLVYVDLYPRHESARLNLGSVATFDVHLQVMNLSPFELELDRANFHFWCGGVKLEAIILKKQKLSAGASKSIYLSGSIGEGQANHIAKLHKQTRRLLTGTSSSRASFGPSQRRLSDCLASKPLFSMPTIGPALTPNPLQGPC